MGNEKTLNTETKIEVITINDNLVFQFFYIPEGFQVSECNLEGFRTEKIGRLNSFNRLKIFRKNRANGEDMVKGFTELLSKKGWDFSKFPNPIAYGSFR